MKITSSEEIALRCLLQMAKHGRDTLSVNEIANQEGTAEPFTAKVLAKLRRGGLIQAVRGRTGGYALAKMPDQISIDRVLAAVARPLFDQAHCRETGKRKSASCNRHANCSLRPVWVSLNNLMNTLLSKVTLADLMSDERAVHEQLSQLLPDVNAAEAEQPAAPPAP